eukprot:TRINITY_DN672_c0_g1_i3.p1 TRINITY_DN672_c0_g1~~TRINITY_DN672_c0_g1_i3.p1  ORF type:complete len:204 (+),score=2.22 TRINITY_DN672_c0_g1_i3:159-770(+)
MSSISASSSMLLKDQSVTIPRSTFLSPSLGSSRCRVHENPAGRSMSVVASASVTGEGTCVKLHDRIDECLLRSMQHTCEGSASGCDLWRTLFNAECQSSVSVEDRALPSVGNGYADAWRDLDVVSREKQMKTVQPLLFLSGIALAVSASSESIAATRTKKIRSRGLLTEEKAKQLRKAFRSLGAKAGQNMYQSHIATHLASHF